MKRATICAALWVGLVLPAGVSSAEEVHVCIAAGTITFEPPLTAAFSSGEVFVTYSNVCTRTSPSDPVPVGSGYSETLAPYGNYTGNCVLALMSGPRSAVIAGGATLTFVEQGAQTAAATLVGVPNAVCNVASVNFFATAAAVVP